MGGGGGGVCWVWGAIHVYPEGLISGIKDSELT